MTTPEQKTAAVATARYSKCGAFRRLGSRRGARCQRFPGGRTQKGSSPKCMRPVFQKAQAIAAKVIHSMEQAAHDMGENATRDENHPKQDDVESHTKEKKQVARAVIKQGYPPRFMYCFMLRNDGGREGVLSWVTRGYAWSFYE